MKSIVILCKHDFEKFDFNCYHGVYIVFIVHVTNFMFAVFCVIGLKLFNLSLDHSELITLSFFRRSSQYKRTKLGIVDKKLIERRVLEQTDAPLMFMMRFKELFSG